MPRTLSLAALAAALILQAPAAFAESAWRDPGPTVSQVGGPARAAYRSNLVACIAKASGCDVGRLSADDQDYIAYELRGQRFAPALVQRVADVRMATYGRTLTPVMGRATGRPYNEPRPAEVASGESTGPGLNLSQGLAQAGGMLFKGLGAAASQALAPAGG